MGGAGRTGKGVRVSLQIQREGEPTITNQYLLRSSAIPNFIQSVDMCTTVGEGDSRPWCATYVDSSGAFTDGSRGWSYCDPRCPFLDHLLRRVDRTTPRPGLRRARPRRTTTEPPGSVRVATVASR